MLHNLICEYSEGDDELQVEADGEEAACVSDHVPPVGVYDMPLAIRKRDEIAAAMWEQYQAFLAANHEDEAI